MQKRKILLIDRPLQLKFILYSVLNGFILFLIMSMIISYFSVGSTRALVENDALDSKCLTMVFQQAQLWGGILVAVVLGGLIWTAVTALYFSHRIAGPVYQMKKKLQAHIAGEEMEKIVLRKNDYFLDLADLINEAMEKKK